jgi:hypothetical protein
VFFFLRELLTENRATIKSRIISKTLMKGAKLKQCARQFIVFRIII